MYHLGLRKQLYVVVIATSGRSNCLVCLLRHTFNASTRIDLTVCVMNIHIMNIVVIIIMLFRNRPRQLIKRFHTGVSFHWPWTQIFKMWAIFSQVLYSSRRAEIMSNFNVLAPNINILAEDSLRPRAPPRRLDPGIHKRSDSKIHRNIRPSFPDQCGGTCPYLSYESAHSSLNLRTSSAAHASRNSSPFSLPPTIWSETLIEILNCPLNDRF